MCDETPEERQSNEMVALQAIYGDAVADNRRKAAWNEFRPLDVSITLNPLHNSEGNHCSATVQFKCCHNYPDNTWGISAEDIIWLVNQSALTTNNPLTMPKTINNKFRLDLRPPVISIKKLHGLSNENATKLLGELEKMAKELCGEVMIFQLAQHIQQFLHDHNKPTLSFYDEMLKEKNEMEQLKKHDLQVKENEERQKMKDEIQRRQEELRSGRRVRLASSQEPERDGQGDAPKLVYYADEKLSPLKKASRGAVVPCTCSGTGAHVLRYTQRNNKKVYVGNCIGHSVNGSTTYLAIDDDGQRVIAKKWCLPPATDFQTRNRQLTSLQQDLRATYRLKYPCLVPYIAMELSTESKRTGKQFIYVFRDFVLGASLKYLQNKCRTFGDKFEGLRLLRQVGLGVFSALSELHSVGVVHRDVRSENVFLEDSGGVKLVGASLDSRLCEMVEGSSYCDRQTKAHDVYAAAQVLLSIVSKETSQEIPPELPGSAKDFFSRCLTEDEHCQWSAEQLINHGFLTDCPGKSPGNRDKENGGSESEDEECVKRIHTISTLAIGHSRLNVEFEILAWLGKGAFGDVLKVRNKLDGGFYAIKHVKLNPKSVELNKKITREVKLLSRLTHENVVRYYNAWIETITETIEDSSVMEESSEVQSPGRKCDSLVNVVAKLGQEVKVNWSMSDGPMQIRDESSESEEDSDNEQDSWFNMIKPDDESSSGVEFEVDSNEHPQSTTPTEQASPLPRTQLKQVLYIQMEFCEKNTLRQAIDNGLYQEHFRAWRLFREILEGLAHVHQKGMIHRDLKPVNIFLDSNDHVKIGDFGLATKVFTGLPVDDQLRAKSQEEVEGLLTGKVGTALYVAPELQQSTTKVIYNQKVDIYSLGIILFEMFHAPFATGTERYAVLSNLRDREVRMPTDFVRGDNAKQIHVIRWLLDHDASIRPTSAELLSSEHVPRAVPEGALSGLLSHTLSERGSRGYQRLVAGCLDQQLSAAEEFTFHSGMKPKDMETIAAIKDCVVKVFRSHGAREFAPPLLTPCASLWERCANAVKVMTSSGSVCHLPHDLRLPFARHIAYSGTKYMRRYVIDRVYRETERTVKGFHPREMIECAFDIVTPKPDTLWPDAELLVAASRAAAECGLRVTVQLNHADLLRSSLLSCGVPPDKHASIHRVLVDVSLGRITSLQLQTHLTTLCVSSRDMGSLLRLMDADIPIEETQELVSQLRRDQCARLDRAVDQLGQVCANARALGCECPITVAPFLAYNATQHSGVFWQMTVVRSTEQRAAKHRSRDLIAAGGRYDALVDEFWKVARAEKEQSAELKCTSVGFSMSLERMAAILRAMEVTPPCTVKGLEPTLIGVSVRGTTGDTRDGVDASRRAHLARELWSGGYSCCAWAGGGADAHELGGAGVLLAPQDAYVLVCCWEGARFREHKVPFIDVVDFIKQKLSPDAVRSPEFGSRSMSWSEGEKTNSPIIAITFITASEKMTKNTKRYCEVQINTQVTSMLSALGLQPVISRLRVNVLALACEAACVRLLAAHLSAPLDAQCLPQAFRPVCDAFFKRQNILEDALKELSNMARQSNQSRNSEETQIYALYSIPDSLCRLIT